MSLIETINEDIKQAMKEKNKDRLAALRAIKSELLLLQTAENAQAITSDVEIKVLTKLVKQRKESAEIYKTNARIDLYDREIAEVQFIEQYLPKSLTEAELTEAVMNIIAQVGASSVRDLGKVMGVASKQLAGKAEGKVIADKVKELLAKM